MFFHDSTLEYLRNRIGRNQSEPAQHGSFAGQQFGSAIPPIHDEISGLVHVRMNYPQCFGIRISKARPQKTSANKRRVTYDELGCRPFWLPRIRIDFLAVDNLRDGLAVPRQYGIPDLNVLESPQDRLVWRPALGSEVPLQIADP